MATRIGGPQLWLHGKAATMSVGKRATLPLQLAVAAAAVSLVALPACGDDDSTSTAGGGGSSTTAQAPVIDPGDGGNYQPKIDPDNFVDVIDNPYLPYPVGASWTYEGTEDGETETVKVTVTPERKEIMGISATVVRDTVTTGDGEVVEDTYDWFAQDRDGNVWYLGEDSTEFENGKAVGTSGSWEAGVDGALPGIVMHAHPEVGQAYRQEYYVGEAEDLAEVDQLDATENVPFGDFDQLVVIKEWNPLEPDVVEEKYFAPGVGLVLEVKTEGGDGRSGLTEYTAGG
jgi:hypothetical protein